VKLKTKQQGFTLIETLVALGIAAVALSVLAGRLGLSADTQRSLLVHATMLEVATNVLEQQNITNTFSKSGKEGKTEARGMTFQWALANEETPLDNFIRQNVVVSFQGEPDVSLFLFHVIP